MDKNRHTMITTFKGVKEVIDGCKQTRYCSFDFETKALGPSGPAYKGKNSDNPAGPAYSEDAPTIIGIAYQVGHSFIIPLFHKDSPFTRAQAKKILRMLSMNLFENKDIIKIAYNFKFEYKWVMRYGGFFRGRIFDAMLAKYLLDEERPNDLKSLVARIFPEEAQYEDEVSKAVTKYGGWGEVPLEILSPYCGYDCELTLKLMIVLEQKLWAGGFYMLFRNMAMMQTRVLAESESQGFIIDRPYLEELFDSQKQLIDERLHNLTTHPRVLKFVKSRKKAHIKKLIADTKEEIKKIKSGEIEYKNPESAIKGRMDKLERYLMGTLVTKKERIDESINFNSVPQLIQLLFTSPKGFQFPIIAYTKDKKKQPTKNPSTAEDVLLELQLKDETGFISDLLKLRELNKLYSTYIISPLNKLNSRNTLNTNYLIHGTVTGRLSSSKPNLQNIPRGTTSSVIKKMFIPPPGHLILEVDYGQAELRVVAEIAKDKAMIELFEKGYNIHVATACKANGCLDRYDEIQGVILKDENHPENLFWTKQKKRAKVINFGIIYGQTPPMLAGSLSEPGDPVSPEEAAEFREDWLKLYPGVSKWFKKQERFLKKHGWVKNIFGRKRRLPGIWSPERGVVNKAIRDSINAPIQGASSDMTQLSSIVIREKVINTDLKLTDDPRYQNQLYTVHDSLGFYIQPKYIHKAVPIIKAICENPDTLKYFGFEMKKVRMKVSAEIGLNWGELKDYKPDVDYQAIVDEFNKLNN